MRDIWDEAPEEKYKVLRISTEFCSFATDKDFRGHDVLELMFGDTDANTQIDVLIDELQKLKAYEGE